jgi:two-component system nitrogen regulation sensor histidine kinase NtrY
MDRARLRQVLLSLLRNAEQAVDDKGSIGIFVGTRPKTALITVSDNGTGVSEQDRQRIFEPFYSTKKNGFGLGLALVKRLVDQARGRITCEQNTPHGMRFHIELPTVGPPRNIG